MITLDFYSCLFSNIFNRVVFLLLFLFALKIHCILAQTSIPIIFSSIGVGPNYGLIGGKTVFGYKNSGLLTALGNRSGLVTYSIGVQFSYKRFYVNWSKGVFGTIREQNSTISPIAGNNIYCGIVIDFPKLKRFFFDLSLGNSEGSYKNPIVMQRIKFDAFLVNIGLGYKFLIHLKEK